jgi:hypothetical protein
LKYIIVAKLALNIVCEFQDASKQKYWLAKSAICMEHSMLSGPTLPQILLYLAAPTVYQGKPKNKSAQMGFRKNHSLIVLHEIQ